MKLLLIYSSPRSPYKLRAVFVDNNRRFKKVDFGHNRYEDYTIHKDIKRRDLYRRRHIKDLETGDPTRPGFLSYYILWGDSTDLNTNIEKYRELFNL